MLPTRDPTAVIRVLSSGIRDQQKRVHGQHECDAHLQAAYERTWVRRNGHPRNQQRDNSGDENDREHQEDRGLGKLSDQGHP